jgi:hypothetical protein
MVPEPRLLDRRVLRFAPCRGRGDTACRRRQRLDAATLELHRNDARPDQRLTKTGDLDCSTTGTKLATISLTLQRGSVYWIGVRHNSTATLSAWAATATPDINGGAIVTTARKALRRMLAHASAVPSTWGFLSSEISAGPATAVRLFAA